MDATLPARAPSRPWLPHPTTGLANWLLCWVVLPNLAFCALWVIATPPRMEAILATGVIGLIVRRAPYGVRLCGFVVSTIYSIATYLSAIFNLTVHHLLVSLRFFAELHPLGSPEYLAAIGAMVMLTATTVRLLRRDMRFGSAAELLVAVVSLLAVAGLDRLVGMHSRGSYNHVPDATAPFESAVGRSGFAAALNGRRHAMIVMVEAMGSPLNPALDRLMFEAWRSPAITSRYQVTFGTNAFYGSTTNGELRELCARWDEYHSVLDKPDANCLPARAGRRGYDATAVHGFNRSFFDRARWYPNIGFRREIFGDMLARQGAGECEGVFPGPCDTRIAPLLGQMLKDAKRPQFLYWLTLNSHLPVPGSAALGTEDCLERNPGFPVNRAGLCRLVAVIRATNASLAAVLTDPALPATEVLIVGDHIPPFFGHVSRSQFDQARVPWVRLVPKDR
ncbi:MAG TPA: sulfatase-like hydrolase/transferase [Sphingomonas sp.]|nr:sulfatase-like hydrolase/transferase [Sphingomonas sp.]